MIIDLSFFKSFRASLSFRVILLVCLESFICSNYFLIIILKASIHEMFGTIGIKSDLFLRLVCTKVCETILAFVLSGSTMLLTLFFWHSKYFLRFKLRTKLFKSMNVSNLLSFFVGANFNPLFSTFLWSLLTTFLLR